MSSRLEVVFLGTGSPLGYTDRCGAGQVVVAGDTHVLVDCGWGAARRLVPAGIRPADIDIAIFTHMHTDHITDVPDFLFQRWTSGATTVTTTIDSRSPIVAVVCNQLVAKPRRPGAAFSVRYVAAPPTSPPSARPCARRSVTSSTGATTPICA